MKHKPPLRALLFASALLVATSTSWAWEAATTSAGIAEQAGLHSALHDRLRTLGFASGLFETLTVPPKDAPQLLAALARCSPTHGYTPDLLGRQTALAWLAAGAAIADSPAAFAVHHFFDPLSGRGYQRPRASVATAAVRATWSHALPPAQGQPAVAWIMAKDNPLSMVGFYEQYAKAVTAATPGERSRHMAAALVALGASVHVLADLGSPSHVRNDAAAHEDALSELPGDVGSRFERIAALAFGRLGVPVPSQTITRTSVRGFITNPEGTGLADVTARHYYSRHTLPGATNIADGNQRTPPLARPLPAPPARLNLMAASRGEGATLRDGSGTCLARYRVESGTLSFFTDDACELEQVAQQLPRVVSYAAGLVDFAMRGQLTMRNDGAAVSVVTPTALGVGTLTLLTEDAQGQRRTVTAQAVSKAAADATLLEQKGVTPGTYLALYAGTDATGEPLVAVGRIVVGS